jgi:hypothetical protein
MLTGDIDPVDWLPEYLNCSWYRELPTDPTEEHRRAIRDVDGGPPFFLQPL